MYDLSWFRKLPDIDITGKRIFLRADLNVPLNSDGIVDDFRLVSLLPTLAYLREQGCTVVLATHLGRPEDHESTLSTRRLLPWFTQHGYQMQWQPNIAKAVLQSRQKSSHFILLENLRFFHGEQQKSCSFAHELAALGDIYLADGFAILHRTDTSVALMPTLFAPEARGIGLLVMQEITALNRLLYNPPRPFVCIVGGGKPEDKLPLLHGLMKVSDKLLLGPAFSTPFAAACGYKIGCSPTSIESIAHARQLLQETKEHDKQVHLPTDYQVALQNAQGPLQTVSANAFPPNGFALSMGPKTISEYAQILTHAGSLFYNCAMGFPGRPETTEGSQALLAAIADSDAYSVIGGGSSVALARTYFSADAFSYLSTGGGATLTYLANEPLPGLDVLKTR